MNLAEVERILEKHKNELKRRFKVKEIGIFGSYVKGEQKESSDLDYIRLDSIEKIEEFVKGMDYDDFLRDVKTWYAVIRVLEIIGKAVKNISDDLKRKYPQVPWKAIAGMRDKLIHAYFGVDWEVVWLTIKKDIPKIKPLFEDMLKGGV